jgi:hypothetical protein
MEAIVIEVGRQRTGATFMLSLQTRAMLPSSAFRPKSVFVSYDTQEAFENLHSPMWDQIAMLLTGLDEEQIRDLGGFRVVSAPDREVLFDSNAA